MFDRMLWQDNVRDPARTYKATQNADGTVTMEPAGKLIQHQLQFEADHEERVSGLEAENIVETGTVTLTNTLKYPFNNSDKTINLTKTRKTTNYLVEARVTGFSGGLPGELSVSDKALNGFKLGFDGSATSVTVKYIVKGGILS